MQQSIAIIGTLRIFAQAHGITASTKLAFDAPNAHNVVPRTHLIQAANIILAPGIARNHFKATDLVAWHNSNTFRGARKIRKGLD